MGKVKAKPVDSILEDEDFKRVIVDGYIEGYQVSEDIIVGDVVGIDSEYIDFEFWVRVKPETMEEIK